MGMGEAGVVPHTHKNQEHNCTVSEKAKSACLLEHRKDQGDQGNVVLRDTFLHFYGVSLAQWAPHRESARSAAATRSKETPARS
jgi:hypothetical protein